MLTQPFPDRLRGLAKALLYSIAAIGAAVAFIIAFGWFVTVIN